MLRRTHNPPMFLKKLSAAMMLKRIESSKYFKDIDTTVRDIAKWESIQREETPEDTAKYDPGTEPAILLAVLRVVAVTETMSISGVTALVAGVLLDAKLEDAYDKLQVSLSQTLEHKNMDANIARERDHVEKYAYVRKILDSLGPKV